MRKNVLVSLLAVTSASMTAYANANLSNQIQNDEVGDWVGAGEGFSLSNDKLVSTTGTSVSQSIGKLVPGTYKFSAGDKTDNVKLIVKVGGTEVENSAEFVVSTESEVEIVIESTDGKGYAVGGFKLELIFDFAAAGNTLRISLSEVTNKLSGIIDNTDVPGSADVMTESSRIQADINKLKDDADDSYQVYTDYQLYKMDDGESLIQKDIKALDADVDKVVANHTAYTTANNAYNELSTKLLTVKTKYNAASPYAKTKYADALNELEETIEGLKGVESAYQNQTAAVDYPVDNTEATKKATNEELDKLSNDIDAADKDDVAYKDVAPMIATAKQNYTTALNNVNANIPSDGVYEDKHTEAQTDLGAAYKLITEAETANGTADDHEGAAASQSDNISNITNAEELINGIAEIIQEVKNLQAKYDEAIEKYDALKESFDDLKAVPGVSAEYEGKIAEIDGLISNLKVAIEEANKNHEIDDFDIDGNITKINISINEFKAVAGDIFNNYDAYEAIKADIAGLQTYLNEKKDKVSKLASGESVPEERKYSAKGKYAGLESGYQTTINELSEGIEEDYKAGKADDNKATYDSKIDELTTTIDAYVSNAEDVVANYDAQILKLISIENAYNSLNDKVTNKAVWVDGESGNKTTYGDKLNEYSEVKSSYNKLLTEAMAATDAEHVTKVLALSFDDACVAEMNGLVGTYDTDYEYYNKNISAATAQSMHNAIETRITTIETSLGLLDGKTADGLGLYYTEGDFLETKEAIKADKAALKTAEQQKYESGETDNYAAYLAYVGEAVTTLQTLEASISDLNKKVSDAETLVTENIKAQNELTEKKNEITDKLATVAGLNEDVSRDTEFTDAVNERTDAVDAIMAEVQKERDAETLSTNKSTYIDKLADELENADDLCGQAEASTRNYKVQVELSTYLTSKNVETAISDAVADIRTITSGGSAEAYYVNLLNGTDGEECMMYKYNALKKSINDNYNDRKFADWTDSQVKAQKDAIDKLLTDIEAVVTNCEANEEAYDAQMASLTSTQAYWNKVYNYIYDNDKSSQQQAWLDRLNTIQAEMTGLSTEIADNYKNGTSAGYSATVTTKLTEHETAIKNVSDEQSGQYDAILAEDNAKSYQSFTDELQKTVDVYNNAVTVLGQYNNIKNAQIKDVVNGDEYATNSEAILKFSTSLTELRNEARNAYQETPAGEVFNEEEFTETAKRYSGKIDEYLTNISKSVSYITSNIISGYISEAKTLVDLYDTYISGYDEEVSETAYKDVNDIIQKWIDNKESNELPVMIDGFEIEYNSIGSLLDAGREEATKKQWSDYDLKEFNNTVSAQQKDLDSWNFDGIAELSAEYNNALENATTGLSAIVAKADKAIEANNLYGSYNTCKSDLDVLSSQLTAIYDEAKDSYESNEANKIAYANVQTKISDANEALAEAAAYADKYFFVDETIESNIAGWQTRLDRLADGAKADYEAGSVNEDYYTTSCTTIVSEIAAFYNRVNIVEYNALVAQVDDLHEYYNTLLKSVAGTDKEAAVKAFESQLADLEKMLEENNPIGIEGKDETVQNNLISVEKAISTVKNGLTAIEDSSKAETAYNVTLANLEALASEYDAENTTLGECYEQVQTKFAARMSEIKSGIDDVRTSLESYKSDILFYQDKIQHAIDLLNTDLDNIAIEIAAEQKIYVDNQTAYEKLSAEINGYEKELQDAIDVINGYASDEFTNYFNGAYTPVDNATMVNYYSSRVKSDIETLRKDVNDRYDATKLDDYSKLIAGYVSRIQNNINDLEKETANSEMLRRITHLSTVTGDLSTKLANGFYTQQAKDEYAGQLEAIITTLNKLNAHINDAWDGSYTTDIDGNTCPEVTVTDFMSEIAEKAFTRINEQLAAYSEISDAIDNSAYKLGDVDEDGVVTVRDYGRILDMVLADVYPEAGSVEALAADCNEDGAINIGDVTKVAQLINSEDDDATTSMLTKRYARMTANNDMLSLSSESEGNVTRVAINLANSVAYAGGQMDIKLPAGMVLVSERLGARANGHELRSNDLANGIHRIVVSSAEANVLTDAEQTVVYLEVSGEGSVDNIEITNIKFADAYARVYSLADLNVGNATGINGVEGSESLRSKIYSVGGQLMNKVKKGINIIRNSDGSTRKVVNKK